MAWLNVSFGSSRSDVGFAMPMHNVSTCKSNISHVEGFPGT
jgi:hypothetical protein